MHAGRAGHNADPFVAGGVSAARLILEQPWRLGRRILAYSSGGSSGSTPAATTDASSGGVKRGGFGSVAHSFSSHFSFGG